LLNGSRHSTTTRRNDLGKRRDQEAQVHVRPSGAIGTMVDQTRIALQNYDWLIRNRGIDDVALA
jgi:hypothetical protein